MAPIALPLERPPPPEEGARWVKDRHWPASSRYKWTFRDRRSGARLVRHCRVRPLLAGAHLESSDQNASHWLLTDFRDRRRAQQATVHGELFDAEDGADRFGTPYRDVFQGWPHGPVKGIVVIDLLYGGLP